MVKVHLRKFGFYYLLFLLWIGCFYNNLNIPYFYDDYAQVANNLKIRDINNLTDIIFCGVRQIRVIQNLSFAYDYFISGANTLSFHITNNIIHLLNCLLIYSFLSKLKQVPKFVTRLTVLLFLTSPLQVQSVSYIMGRISLLQNFSLFLLLNELAKFSKRSKLKILLILFFSYLVKENNALMPLIILIFDYSLDPKFNIKDKLKNEYWPYWLSVLFYIPLYQLLKDPTGMYKDVVGFKLYWGYFRYFITQGYFNFLYLFLIFNPHQQLIHHEFPFFTNSVILLGIVNWLLIFFFYGYLFIRRKIFSISFFFFSYFLILHCSTNSILQMVNPFAEYRLSISLLPILLGLSYLIFWIRIKFNFKYIFEIIFICYFSIFTHLHNHLWQEPIRLWYYALETEETFYSHLALAQEFHWNNVFSKALEHLEKGQKIGTYVKYHRNQSIILKAKIYFTKGDFQKAVISYVEALKMECPFDDSDIHDFLVSLYFNNDLKEFHNILKLAVKERGPNIEKAVNYSIKIKKATQKSGL